MTRISGHHIVRTKCCKTFFSTLAYSSMNFSAREYWTDGATVDSLTPSTGGLCRCTCGEYFLLKDAEKVQTVRTPKPIPPRDWNNDAPHFLMLPGETTQQYKNRIYDTRPIKVIEAERVPLPQDVQFIKDPELIQVIESASSEYSLMLAARRRYWRYLNDPYREAYRLLRETDKSSFAPYAPTEMQLTNMQQILDLVNQGDEPNCFEVCELYREMSNFYEAQQALDLAKEPEPRLTEMMSELLSKKVNAPVRYKL